MPDAHSALLPSVHARIFPPKSERSAGLLVTRCRFGLSDPSDPHPKPIPLIIRGDFLDCANEATRPDNRSTFGLMMQVCEGVIENFTHGKAPHDQVRELRFQFGCEVLGLRLKEADVAKPSGPDDETDDLI
jgi:hypothetical protein